MNSSRIKLLKSSLISYFPSGSAIEIFDDLLYIIGDDTSEILLLDKDYNPLDSTLDKPIIKRISKEEKIDLEASTIIDRDGKPYLLIVGSGSKKNREKVVLLPLPYSERSLPDTIDNSSFITALKNNGVEEVNIEGVAAANNHLIFANRANLKNPLNQLIITNLPFPNSDSGSTVTIKKIALPTTKHVVGISGLAYDSINDILLFTASTEETENAYDDGAIGDSYIGYIQHMSTHKGDEIKADGFINLSESNKSFLGEKIESVCIENISGKTYTLHLASDNDKGTTRLFKINLTL